MSPGSLIPNLPGQRPGSAPCVLGRAVSRPALLEAHFATGFCAHGFTGKSLQFGAVVMGPAVLPASKLLFLTSPCLGGKPVATLAGLWSRACQAPTHLAKSRAVLGSECSALFPAPSLTPAPPSAPHRPLLTHSIPGRLAGLVTGVAQTRGSIPSPSVSFLVSLG